MELEIIPEKKIRVSRDQVEEKFSLGNLQLQFGRKLEYLEDEIKQKPEIVTNVELCKGQGYSNQSHRSMNLGCLNLGSMNLGSMNLGCIIRP